MELASCHLSDAWAVEMALRRLGNWYSLVEPSRMTEVFMLIRKIVFLKSFRTLFVTFGLIISLDKIIHFSQAKTGPLYLFLK